jgi:hypothetical protein
MKTKKHLYFGLVLFSSLFLTACTNQNTASNTKSEDNSNTKQEENSSFSLRDLIAQNIPQKCTYSGSNQEGSFTSEVIISGKKFNQTIKTKSSDGEQTINSVSDGEYVYTWGTHSVGGSYAIKLKADFSTQATSDDEKNSGKDVVGAQLDLDTNYQGSCSPTVVTDANFQAPKDVKFEDYSKFLDDIKSSIPSIDPKDLEQ